MISIYKGKTNITFKVGDYIIFKHPNSINDHLEYCKTYGIIKRIVERDLFEISMYDIYTKSLTIDVCWISPSNIIKHYSTDIIPTLTPRLVLKDIWKNLVFREVKTVKTKSLKYIAYPYKDSNGFQRNKIYRTEKDALNSLTEEEFSKSTYHYDDYYGFTTNRCVRDNDIFHYAEIFFSRKCYGELNLNGKFITFDFSNKCYFRSNPPKSGQYICGLVEDGEKGLFFRKWFVCSKEFMLLWTLICDPQHNTLRNRTTQFEHSVKTFDEILNLLDTSKYYKKLVDEIEPYPIHIKDVYKILANILFPTTSSKKSSNSPKKKSLENKRSSRRNSFDKELDNLPDEELYESYSKKLYNDLLWMKIGK